MASHSAQAQIMRPARMFPGIWERKLTLCGEPQVSPPPRLRSNHERHQQPKDAEAAIDQRGAARCNLRGPGRVRLLRKHPVSITPISVQLPGRNREWQSRRPEWLPA